MLHSKLLIASAAMLLTTTAFAQSASDTRQATPTERSSVQELIKQMQQSSVSATPPTRDILGSPDKRRRVDQIADSRMAEERAKVLRFLNIDPDSEHALYIFVSWSMPLPMLRAYAIEAMWTGGTLVFRGLPPGRTMKDFFVKDLSQLVWDKGASAAVSLDPRLFDAYQVESVPAIVLSKTRDNLNCSDAGERSLESKGRTFHYSRCPPIAQDRYVKMSGTITLDYALEAFQRAGHPEAATYLSALRRGYPAGRKAPQTQAAFEGDWANAFTPRRLMEQTSGQDSHQ